MKRKGNLYHKMYDMQNIRIAAKRAMKGKSRKKAVIRFKEDFENNLIKLHYLLRTKTYKTSPYRHFKIKENKVRDISSLPFYPDNICHHILMLVIDPIIIPTFTSITYNCIKGRGLHKGSFALRKMLKDEQNTKYCLKIDIKKFYPSVDTGILKQLLRRKIKDNDLLKFIDELLDSHPGLPLGSYPSQNLANFYLSGFDHYLKETCGVKYVLRYCDDLVILASNKEYLHDLLIKIKVYLKEKLNLEVKSNHQVFPVESRLIDFLGYPTNHRQVKLRPGIKRRFARMLKIKRNDRSIAAYKGWLDHCDGKHLKKKLLGCDTK